MPRHFDIVKASDETGKLEICGAMPFTMEGFLDEPAEYNIEMVVIADGISTPLSVRVGWNGKWDEIDAWVN